MAMHFNRDKRGALAGFPLYMVILVIIAGVAIFIWMFIWDEGIHPYHPILRRLKPQSSE